MKKIIKKLPVPIVGLMLGLVATGNLLLSYGESYRNIFGLLSAIVLALVILKVIIFPQDVKKSLDNVVVASVFPTLSMGIMLLSTYIKNMNHNISYGLWIIGVILHIGLILYFTKKHVLNFNINKVFPSWFIVYVGLAMVSITAPGFNKSVLGKIAFYFGFLSLLVLLPVVFKRILIIKEIPDVALPTLAILTAPAALCLAGYMNSFEEKNMLIVYFLLILSQGLYLIVLTQLPSLLRLKFSPAYSAFTFPMVITGVSLKLTNGFLIKSNRAIPILKYLIKFEEIVAVALVLYVLIRYINFLFAKPEEEKDYKVIKEN